MKSKVRCEVCSNQTAGFCGFKKTKVKLNKKRVCDKFKYDAGKEKEKQFIETVRRPDWYWDKEEKKKEMKKELKRLQELEKERVELEKRAGKIVDVNDVQMIRPRDLKYPLTGDLSRFTTTVNEENKE